MLAPCPCGHTPVFLRRSHYEQVVCAACLRAGPQEITADAAQAAWATMVTPPAMVRENIVGGERARVASFLLCEAFEQRFDPAVSALLAKLARAVQQGVDPSVPLAEMDIEEPPAGRPPCLACGDEDQHDPRHDPLTGRCHGCPEEDAAEEDATTEEDVDTP